MDRSIKILIFSLNILFLIIVTISKTYSFERVYKYDVPDSINLIFNDYKKYLININEAINEDFLIHEYIKKKYKKSLKIKGKYVNKKNKEIFFKGRARISGDWMDHILKDELTSSLSISLSKGNLGGITRFRLLLPRTRNNENEILWSILMEEIGFPVPFRKFIKVNLMGKEKIYILEERAEKEFLESWGFRETPIVEWDEREVWDNDIALISDEGKDSQIRLHKLRYPKFKIENGDFIKNSVARKISYRSLKPFYVLDNRLNQIFNKLNIQYAEHGLKAHNRKYIYDAIYNDYIPIYFDGMVKIPEDICNKNVKNFPENNQSLYIIKKKFFERTLGKTKFTKQMECFVNEILTISKGKEIKFEEILELEKINVSYENFTNKEFYEKNLKIRPPIYKYNSNMDNLQKCHYDFENKKWNKCEKKNKDFIKKAFEGNDLAFKSPYFNYTIPIDIDYKPSVKESFFLINANKKNININVGKNEIGYIKLIAKDSDITLNLEDNTAFALIYGSNIENTKITSRIKKNKKLEVDSRYNEKLLTACTTFLDSQIKNSQINTKNCNNEDAINFIRVEGNKVSLNISNSSYDAFDADFSNVNFDNIYIKNSGNDCIDVSSGIYNFRILMVENCNDKGVSVGERSITAIEKISIHNSNIGIASKDSSVVYLSNILSKNVSKCLSVYQKKQEYGIGTIYLLNNKNNVCKVKVTKNLKILNNDICKKISKNYFYTICKIDKKFKISIENKSYIDGVFVVENYLGKKVILNFSEDKNCHNDKIYCSYVFENDDNYKSIILKFGNIEVKETLL